VLEQGLVWVMAWGPEPELVQVPALELEQVLEPELVLELRKQPVQKLTLSVEAR
jgi:hypothetical protein